MAWPGVCSGRPPVRSGQKRRLASQRSKQGGRRNWATGRGLSASVLMLLGSAGLAAACSASDYSLEGGDGAVPVQPDTSTGGGTSVGTPEEPVAPEMELEESFLAPAVSGPYLFTANPETNRVALIDARDFGVRVLEGGNGPTYLSVLPEGKTGGGALVHNVRSRDASVFLLDDRNQIASVRTVEVQEGGSGWAVGEQGAFAVSWSRYEDKLLGPGDGYQEITVMAFPSRESEDIVTRRLSVGYRPSQIMISSDETRAFAVSQPGMSVIDLTADQPTIEREIFLPPSGESARDVSFIPSGRLAFVRLPGQLEILAVDTELGTTTSIDLPAEVTDLDVSSDGSTALAVMPGGETVGSELGGQGGAVQGAESRVAIMDTSEVKEDPDSFQVVEVPEYVGSAVLSADGRRAMLFTNAIESPIVALLDVESGAVRTVDVKAPALAGFIAEDSSYGVMLMGAATGAAAGAFALIPLGDSLPVRVQGTSTEPRFVSFAEDRVLVTTAGSATTPAEAFLGRFPTLSVDRYELSNRPLSTGVVPEAGQAFVSQQHSEGRVMFIDLESGQQRTVTGFELSSRVVSE